MTHGTTTVCPECDSPQITPRNHNAFGAHDPGGDGWYCHDCHREFDDPDERERRNHGTGGDFSDAYRALADADPEEVLGE